jgi:hypothetical protein
MLGLIFGPEKVLLEYFDRQSPVETYSAMVPMVGWLVRKACGFHQIRFEEIPLEGNGQDTR